MVLINGVKYACERCIRGHRVTTCNHTDQPLMMIKPKGRPSTTCAYCKELRKNKNGNIPGSCTCGRQEKKRLAQKAKEEARAKAKEQLLSGKCTCNTKPNEVCTYHHTLNATGNKYTRQQKKLMSSSSIDIRTLDTNTPTMEIHQMKNNHSKANRSHARSNRPKFERAPSSASLDANFVLAHGHHYKKNHNGNNNTNNNTGGPLSDNASVISSSYLDSEIGSGKISKDYHHVPSLASLSSLHSQQSLEHNFSLPQSPPLSNLNFNFITGNSTNNSNHHSRHTTTANNWDNASINSANSSNLIQRVANINTANNIQKFQSTNNNSNSRIINSIDENGNNNNNSNTNNDNATQGRMRAGEVVVPLEEYVPSDINGVGKITDKNLLLEDWDPYSIQCSNLNLNLNRNQYDNVTATTTKTNLNELDTSTLNGLDLNNGNMDTNSSQHGLLDMFPDSSTISTLSRANLLLQERNDGLLSINNSTDPSSNNRDIRKQTRNNINMSREFSNSNYTNNNVLHGNINDNGNGNGIHHSSGTSRSRSWRTQQKNVSPQQAKSNLNMNMNMNTNNNSSALRNVEVLSITPSFMDIPESGGPISPTPSISQMNMANTNNDENIRHILSSTSLSSSKQRSFSIDRNHRYTSPSALMGGKSTTSPTTINPSIVSTIDDQISLNSIQSFPNSTVNDMVDVSTNTDYSNTFQSQPSQPQQQSSQQGQYPLQIPLSGFQFDTIPKTDIISPGSNFIQFNESPNNKNNNNNNPNFQNVNNTNLDESGNINFEDTFVFKKDSETAKRTNSNSPLKNSNNNSNNNSDLNTNLNLNPDATNMLRNNEMMILNDINGGIREADLNINNNVDKNLVETNVNGGSNSSPISSIQTASPPSQLLTEHGFQELDNFMSTL
ncbi:Haa1p NDAI_0B03070 [Naumovozyma dairenensis CBS 421]|uniref:Copper-fist domain-containing protein n=1 Tax=Naumovozyma dairenensis (strain ATCC 10597 / BCRC 20456 / CBS 421 / NBRC 0211 / NRRL Y-12639) TaxID=1071378 RepID=G0W6D1_NAUDC|nr:hypothetical protein NDAI_0B03070 [Naumovozyma dairenensis CBS 421]CCD23342.1 hypothetical protein NDAI_0B03070 [Naumovozyma dairenensis CBS 421]